MARFRATIKGQRGEASRLGSSKSGIRADVNGWHLGVRVWGEVVGGHDVFHVYKTAGSMGRGKMTLVGIIRGEEDAG